MTFMWWQNKEWSHFLPIQTGARGKMVCFEWNHCSPLFCPVRRLHRAQGCWIQCYFCGLWFRSKFNWSPITPFPPFCLICAADTYTVCTQNSTRHIFTQVPSLNHVVTTCASSQAHFSTTGVFTFSSLLRLRGVAIEGQGKREKAVGLSCIKGYMAPKPLAFRNSNVDTLHLYKLARHSEIVPLINNCEL